MPDEATRMPERIRPTEADGKRALVDHAAAKACDARQVYGSSSAPGIPLEAFHSLLEDRRFVRYRVRINYDAAALQAGEFAHIQTDQEGCPEPGYTLFIHPSFEGDENLVPVIAAYYLVCVNYGEIAGPEASEAFGAALMGMDRENYYSELCRIADSLLS